MSNDKDSAERIIRWEPGFDCIRFECMHGSAQCYPGSGGSHGVHGLSIRFILKKNNRAVYLLVFTHWLPEMGRFGKNIIRPTPAQMGYHSPVPIREDQDAGDCDLLGRCYSDAHFTGFPEQAFAALCNAGIEALWNYLEEYYEMVFNGGSAPNAVPYPKPKRKEMQ